MQGNDLETVSEALSQGDLDAAPLPDAERELLRFVAKVTRHANRTTDDDVQALRDLGWSDPQIAECVYITALFAFFNRVADAFGLEGPNDFSSPPPSEERRDDERTGSSG